MTDIRHVGSTALENRLRDEVRNLEAGMETRDVIGQAKGILMERLLVTAEEAFELLKVMSQRHNLKLSEVARDLARTGEWISV